MDAGLIKKFAEIEVGLMKRIFLNESGTFYKINIVFCAELSETNCRAELSEPNCPTPNCPRRIVRAELSCAELSGNRSSVRVFLWYLFSTPRKPCVSLILSTIKEYYLYAKVVKLVTIQLEFLTIFPAFSSDLGSLDQSIGDTRPRSCRTDVANTVADL